MKNESLKPMETMTNMPNKGAWTAEEDRKLAEVIAIHGARRWKTVAAKAAKEEHRVEKNVRESNLDSEEENKSNQRGEEDSNLNFNVDDFFDFSNEDPLNLEWMNQFLEIDKA
ncbi:TRANSCRIPTION FACTOR MYB8-RELATED-RELATED [Salix purpurea]|uniref:TRANSCRIPTION FACTOR MYB8-RELATED-RELATED n=1 Tax=Salix purpurea TaxID=77065 RepID=A0A9Q0T9T0_SALPP|nr:TRANSCRIPTION FACTOR MYB8-RELATED-RELATED [Salix purpurea]